MTGGKEDPRREKIQRWLLRGGGGTLAVVRGFEEQSGRERRGQQWAVSSFHKPESLCPYRDTF